MVQPGLESVAADEITRDLGGEIKKSERGMVVFRVPAITPDLLRLRTVEDVFLLAWGSDALSLRAEDLDKIKKWTARSADWASPMIMPLVSWVTTQDPVPRQRINASRSTSYPIQPGDRSRRIPANGRSGVALLLLPLLLELEDGLP